MPTVMLLGRFARTLRHRGPALAHWPVAERDAALLLLRVSPGARCLLADALDFPGPAAADGPGLAVMRAGLHGRLDRRQAEAKRALAWGRPHGLRALRVAALAACAMAGLWVGTGVAEQADAGDVLAVVQVAALGTPIQ